MSETAVDNGSGVITFEAFGVTTLVTTNRREARDRIAAILPPGWRPCTDDTDIKNKLAILGDERGTYGVDIDGTLFTEGVALDVALESLDSAIRTRIAHQAPDRIFVHAGVVATGGGALLIPGNSFTGKTTLVAALVRAGATYFSDEYAALDDDGLVHPYAKPLSIRDADQVQRDHHVETLGGNAGDQALPVHTVILSEYRPGAEWDPQPLAPGPAALEVLTHTVPARDRPKQSLHAITEALKGATILTGDRGEADALVPRLLGQTAAAS